MNLGRHDFCLSVSDIRKSEEFYKKLQFVKVEGNIEENWLVLANGPIRLGLYGEEHIKEPLFNFRGGKVAEINKYVKMVDFKIKAEYKEAEKGGGNLTILDPDKNSYFFDTHHSELGYSGDDYIKENPVSTLGEPVIVVYTNKIDEMDNFYNKMQFSKIGNIYRNGNLAIELRLSDKSTMALKFRHAKQSVNNDKVLSSENSIVDPDGLKIDFEFD